MTIGHLSGSTSRKRPTRTEETSGSAMTTSTASRIRHELLLRVNYLV